MDHTHGGGGTRPVRWGESVSGGGFVLPVGTVTLMLGDIEGSTRLWEDGSVDMAALSTELDSIVTRAVDRHGGVRPIEQGEGDSFLAAFSRASDAAAAAVDVQRALTAAPAGGLQVRIGIHTGEVVPHDGRTYLGPAVNRAARIRDSGHGGQVLVSGTVAELVETHMPDGAQLLDLGSFRLRDLGRAERLFQVWHPELRRDFPPLRGLDDTPHNLPVQVTTFVGRATEIADVARRLVEHRMVTLTGSGGCGKTRLALQVAAELTDRFPDGVWFVDLSAVDDPGELAAAVATAARIPDAPGRPPVDRVVGDLARKRSLVVLDNCEQIVDACAAFADTLLRGCPGVHVLATSRELLGVGDEVAWRVPSLTLPTADGPSDVESLTAAEAVQLFVERAQRARPNFAVTNTNVAAVVSICQQLDGIPLAIELAAARVRVLTIEQIEVGLADRFRLLGRGPRTALPRQATLAASVAWSYALLRDDERLMLARLSAFPGSFDLDAAEAVGSAEPIPQNAVLELVSSLVDRSLVVAEEHGSSIRYRLLETIRAYATERLVEMGNAADTRDRLLEHFVGLAEEEGSRVMGPHQQDALHRLDNEDANLRAVAHWLREGPGDGLAIRLAAALGLYWVIRGREREAAAWIDDVLASAADEPIGHRGRALCWRAWAAFAVLDYGSLFVSARQAEAIARQIDDPVALAGALGVLGWGQVYLDPDAAAGSFEQAAELGGAHGVDYLVADALQGLGHLALYIRGSIAEATDLLERSIDLGESFGERVNVARARTWLAQAAAAAGDFRAARREHESAIAASSELAVPAILVGNLAGLAWIDAAEGLFAEAKARCHQAIEIATRGEPEMAFDTLARLCLGHLERTHGDRHVARELGEEMARTGLPGAWREPALTLLALVALDDGDEARAASYVDEAMARTPTNNAVPGTAGVALDAVKVWRRLGRHDKAVELAQAVVADCVDNGATVSALRAIEQLAGLAADAGDDEQAARLFGAVGAARAELGHRWVDNASVADVSRVRERLGPTFDTTYAEGSAMSLDDAAALVRRGRGVRGRPASGWAALTPTELQVVELVSRGLSNPEIGARLFMSRRTVASHLTHTFAKLGLRTRAELTAAALRRSS